MSHYRLVDGRMRKVNFDAPTINKVQEKKKQEEESIKTIKPKQNENNIRQKNKTLMDKILNIEVKPNTETKGKGNDSLFERVNNVSMERLKKFANLKI